MYWSLGTSTSLDTGSADPPSRVTDFLAELPSLVVGTLSEPDFVLAGPDFVVAGGHAPLETRTDPSIAVAGPAVSRGHPPVPPSDMRVVC